MRDLNKRFENNIWDGVGGFRLDLDNSIWFMLGYGLSASLRDSLCDSLCDSIKRNVNKAKNRVSNEIHR